MNAAQLALIISLHAAAPVPELSSGDPERDETARRYLADVRELLGFERVAFNALVLSAWDDGLLELERADIPYDFSKVEASEITLETETFHYVAPVQS